jgi:hypothetical protein
MTPRSKQYVYNADMSIGPASSLDRSARRPSSLSEQLTQVKLAEVRIMSPAERLRLALELSDTCLELQRACLPKP